MSEGYAAPSALAWAEQQKRTELEAEARRRPREDWTDLTYEEFKALSGSDLNQLYRADPNRYAALRAEGETR